MDWWTESLWPVVAALLPTAGLAYLFYVIMKHILEADRRERAALREWDREQARLREESSPGEADRGAE